MKSTIKWAIRVILAFALLKWAGIPLLVVLAIGILGADVISAGLKAAKDYYNKKNEGWYEYCEWKERQNKERNKG